MQLVGGIELKRNIRPGDNGAAGFDRKLDPVGRAGSRGEQGGTNRLVQVKAPGHPRPLHGADPVGVIDLLFREPGVSRKREPDVGVIHPWQVEDGDRVIAGFAASVFHVID